MTFRLTPAQRAALSRADLLALAAERKAQAKTHQRAANVAHREAKALCEAAKRKRA